MRNNNMFGFGRRPVVSPGTDANEGYSVWHLAAAGRMDEEEVSILLESTIWVENDVLIDDLREALVCPIPDAMVDARGGGRNPAFQQAIGCTPLEICLLRGRSLVPPGYPQIGMSPVVLSFHRWVERVLEERRWFLPTTTKTE